MLSLELSMELSLLAAFLRVHAIPRAAHDHVTARQRCRCRTTRSSTGRRSRCVAVAVVVAFALLRARLLLVCLLLPLSLPLLPLLHASEGGQLDAFALC